MINSVKIIEGLPGEEIVRKGLIDLEREEVTIESLLVWIASPPLLRCGLPVKGTLPIGRDAELELYDLLANRGDADPYSKYSSLLGRIGKFRRALESQVSASNAK